MSSDHLLPSAPTTPTSTSDASAAEANRMVRSVQSTVEESRMTTAARVNREASSAQSSNSPRVHHPPPSLSSEPLNTAVHIPQSSFYTSVSIAKIEPSESVNGEGYSSTPPTPYTVLPLHPQHQYQQQQQHSHFFAGHPASAPAAPHLYYQNVHHSGFSTTQQEPYYYYQNHEDGHSATTSHQSIWSPLSPQEQDQRGYPVHPSNNQLMMPPASSYYSPHYQSQVTSAAVASNREERHQHQMAPSSTTFKRMNSYHPYHSFSQQSQQEQTKKSRSPLQSSFSSPNNPIPIKASSIFTPAANMMPDVRYGGGEGSAPNYGRLPDGKIIELYPAMMRTIQACEYCRSRKAKCSGGLPCERCAKKDVKCEYAQLDKKRKVKVTTSERDMSGGGKGVQVVVSAGKGGKGGSVSSGKGRSRLCKKVNRSVKQTSSSDVDDVPMDLNSSPFTPISLLYQGGNNKNHHLHMPIARLPFNPAHPAFELQRLGQDQFSPTSTTSQSSSEMYISGPAPEAMTSPVSFYSAPRLMSTEAWIEEETAEPSCPQQSAFRRSHISSQTSFF